MSGSTAGSGRCPADCQLDFELGAKYAALRMDNPPETYLRCKVAFIGVPLLPAALPVGTHRLCLGLYRCLIGDEGTLPDAPLQLLPKCLRYVVIQMTVANQQRSKGRSRTAPSNSRLCLEAPARRGGSQRTLENSPLNPAYRRAARTGTAIGGVKLRCSPVATVTSGLGSHSAAASTAKVQANTTVVTNPDSAGETLMRSNGVAPCQQ